ncbi:hypothetical protein ACFQYP_37980 [Nonomuraea antimicrobica]
MVTPHVEEIPSVPGRVVLGGRALRLRGRRRGAQPSAGATASTTAAAKDKKQQFEAAKADCMKQKGFKYVPYVKPEEQVSEEERKRDSGDYQAMRKYREKYGFEAFSQFVYPDEIGIPAAVADHEADPNAAVIGSLSGAQLDAYNKAKDGCVSQAAKRSSTWSSSPTLTTSTSSPSPKGGYWVTN